MNIFSTTLLLLLGVTLTISTSAQGNNHVDSGSASLNISSKYLEKVGKKLQSVDDKVSKESRKALLLLRKQEERIKSKLSRKDSAKAALIFGSADAQYQKLQNKLESPGSLQQYIPALDSLGTSLKFLNQNPDFLSSDNQAKKLQQALGNVKELDGQLQKAEDIKRFLKTRKGYLNEQLAGLGFAKDLKKLNKQVYYFSAQLQEYKSLLKDHNKAERKALALLAGSKQFQDFMRKNSVLASLFRLPGSDNGASSSRPLAGLQTRSQVNTIIQQQITSGGANARQQFQQNLRAAQSQIATLKNKLGKYGAGSNDEIMPEGFKPNSQKTKSFLKRLELGTNIQSQKANGYFPVTSDIGLTIGYKLNDKYVIGIGSSYKLGWGQNIRHINITHQGVGLRSFVDWKIKGTFWISGGYEMNYRSEFDNVEQLKDLNAWQQSGLIGVSKVVSLKTKFFKKTRMQLLWDLLSYNQLPRTQAVVFRVGYNFK